MSSSDYYSRDDVAVERGPLPLDIDNVHMLLQVEQEQIQKRTFTNWVNAQLAKRRPPCAIVDLFNDFRDGSKLLDLLEVMSNQRFSRERGRGMFQHRSNIEKALNFLKKKSIKLVNINIPDIIDGRPSIILGLVWTIILQYHIEELASSLSFSSRQSSMESLASLDSRSTLSSSSARSSPVPPRGSPLHSRFRVSAKKALMLWVREQCHKAGCTINVKDFKGSWRSGVVFLAILYALRPDLVDLSKARTRSNRQNLEEAFRIAERELRIPRLLEPDDVDVRDPDEKSIMTYVAQFLQYSRDVPAPDEEMQTQLLTPPKTPSPVNLPVHYTPAISASPLRQATPDRKAQEVTCWLVQAYDELLEGWDSTEGESYSERYHVFQTFLVSFNEQRRPIMPLLTAMRRTSKLSEEQRALREAWDSLTEKIREYKVELDVSLPPPLEAVARWLLRAEGVLGEEQGDPQDHGHAADDAREKQELLKVCLEEMPQQLKTFQLFQNLDEYGNMLIPTDKMDEIKRRFTSVRVTAKYHGIKLEYREHRHTVLDLLGQIRTKLRVWKRPYISPEAVRVLLQEWHELVNTQDVPSLLDAALHKLKQVSEKYASKSALASDYHQVSEQVKQLAEDTAAALGEVTAAKSNMGRVLSAWDSYSDCLSSMQAWLEQGSATHSSTHRPEVTPESLSEWGSRHAHLNEVGNFLMAATDPQTSRTMADELRRLNMHWAEFVKKNTSDSAPEPSADFQAGPQDLQALIREATLLLKEPLETMAGPLRTYRKRIQFLMRKIKEVDLDALVSSPEFPVEQLQKLKLAIPEVMQTLCEAEQVCAELQHSVSGLDSRLAELLHWESEARELYHLLRASERQQAKGQDPRARALISRGLQLEGQVVTEEQDLQVMVMTSQKNSPIQYLHASAMQDRVRVTVAQSQEAVGMLSSLGARRDRSRSPPEGPPSKILIRGKEKPQHLRESESSLQLQAVSQTDHETFMPKIVVQEYQDEKMTSPPLSYSYAEAVRGLASPTEAPLQASAAAETQLLTDEIVLRQQQEQMLRHTNVQQHQQKVVELPPRPPQQQKQEPEVEHPQEEMYQVQQQVVTQMKVETEVRQTSEIAEQTPHQESVVKKPLSSQELKSRKAQAMRNRPWLHKSGGTEQKPNQESTQQPAPIEQPQPDRETVASVQVIHQQTGTQKAVQPEAQGMAPKKLQKQKSQESKLSKLEQQQEKPQQTKQPQQQKPAKPKQEERKQKQPQLTPTVKQAKPDSDTTTISHTVAVAQAQTKAGQQSQGHTVSQSQAGVQLQSAVVSQTNTQQASKATAEEPATLSHDYGKTQTQIQTQVVLQSQTSVPTVSQQSVQANGQLQPVAHGQAVAQVRPLSPMQASLHGHIQPPVPSHVQLRSHPQSWAPVRPPSPKPPSPKPPTQVPSTHHQAQTPTQPQLIAEHQTYPQTQTQTQSSAHTIARSSNHPQALAQSQSQPPVVTQSQIHTQSVSHIQAHAQPIPHPHSNVPPMGQPMMHTQPLAKTQVHAQSPAMGQTFAQPMGQLQGHPQMQYQSNVQAPAPHLGHISQVQMQAWTQVRPSSPMPGQPPQAMAQQQMYPHGYPQAQSPAHQWTSRQEPQHQAIAQQRQPIPQPFAQQMCQPPQSMAYPAAQAHPQWTQAGPQQGPQMGPPGMGQAYHQPQAQSHPPWAQTPTPMRPQSPMQPLQMRGYNIVNVQKHGEVHQQTWEQVPPHPQAQPHPFAQSQPQQYSPHQPQTQRHPQPYIQAPIPQPPRQTTPQFPAQQQLRPQLQSQTPSHVQKQQLPQSTVQAQTQQPPQLSKPVPQSVPRPEALTLTQTKPETLPQTVSESQLSTQLNIQTQEQSSIQSSTQLKSDLLPKPTAEPKAPTQPKVQSPTEPRSETLPKPMHEQQLPPQPKVQSPSQLEAKSLPQPTQSEPQSPAQTQVSSQTPPKSKTQDQTQALPKPPPQSPPQPIPQQPRTVALSQVSGSPESQADSPDLFITPPVLAQAPPQAYTEAYAKAQALARNGFEEAKHCLQEHIMEAISIFKDKCLSAEQVSVKEETLRTLDPELLEEFLRAAKGMKAFCTPSQLSDMEFFTQSVTSQWQAVRAEISGFLPQLRFEVTRKYFNSAALQCEKLLNSQLENEVQACFSADGSFAQAGQHLEALRELCDTLSPEDAHRLAQTQLRECENRLAAIQRQFSGDQDAPPPKEPAGSSDQPLTAAEPVLTIAVEKKEVEKQSSVEEDVSRKEALEKYENCKRTLQAQLAKNEHSLKDIPSDSVSLKGLHTRLQEIQFLRQETESLWSDFANQCSQLYLEHEKLELLEQWRNQQSSLQSRGSSLAAALRQIDSTENHMVDFTDRLDRYLRQPKDITAFTLANTNILKDIKELDDNIQNELDQLSRLDPESSSLDPRDCFPLTREVETHRTSLDQLRQQVRKSEAAARALDRFLMSLRTVDEDISGVQGAPCSDATVLQDCRSKLALIRQSIDSLKEKAPQLDLLLQGARLTVTRDGAPASCLDMVGILLKKLEDADSGLLGQQQNLKKETQSRSMGLRKRTLLGELRKLQETIENRGLKEPTMPAVQQRLRALSDLEEQLQAQNSELQSLRQLQEKQGEENVLQELETQYGETQRALTDSKQQCSVLMELLKRFQGCRSQLSSTLQRAEQTIGDQASYMGKDNLQKSITKVRDMKEELSGLGERMEDIRGVCKQLQSQLRNFTDCSEASFESEADALMDNWLDVTEKTDAYMDNLQVALELWEKQLMLGSEVDSWAVAKLALFAESHPFHTEPQVLAMRDEINANEENIEHFHKKSEEIQGMLQSQEAPLELQVMETQLKKRMEQVKELFTDCTDVFEELMAVKKHLAEKIEECQLAVENIQSSISKIEASEEKVETQIQDLSDDLQDQEEQAEAVMKEMGLVSSVASPQVLEVLAVDCSRLRDAITRTKDMIHLKREERDKGLLKVIDDEKQSFENWFQDLQLSVNECFENPESRSNVEISLQRLTVFLKSPDAERRLDQLRAHLERGSAQLGAQQLSDLADWLTEQQEEVSTFKAHCHNRQQQMEALHGDLESLQKQHDSFRDWLQSKEKQSTEPNKVKDLLKDLQDESQRAENLGELLASVRRQGVRGDGLLKDGDNMIQRYRKLQGRLQDQAESQRALEEEVGRFQTQAESTTSWIKELLQPLTSAGKGELQQRAETLLNSRQEGDSKLDELKSQNQRLVDQDELDQNQRLEAEQLFRDVEAQWQKALQAAEAAVVMAQTQERLDKEVEDFRTQSESMQAWIRDLDQNLQAGGHGVAEEKLHVAQVTLQLRPDGESKLQDLKGRAGTLCDSPNADEGLRREVEDTVRHAEMQLSAAMKAAQDALSIAEAETTTEAEYKAFRNEKDKTQTWIKEQKQKLLSLGSHMTFEERLQVTQAAMASKPEGECKVQNIQQRGQQLCEKLDDNRRAEVTQQVREAEQQLEALLQATKLAELRTLSDDFDDQSTSAQTWIREKQQQLQAVGSQAPPQERHNTAENILSFKPDGDCKVNNLRRRGQTLCDCQDVDEARKSHIQQSVKDTEEQWRTVLQAAKQVSAGAEAQISQETKRRDSELSDFEKEQQCLSHWLAELQQRLKMLADEPLAKERLQTANDALNSKAEGDSKIQNLKSQVQSLCEQNLDETKKTELQQMVRDAEDCWNKTLQDARTALEEAERRCALEAQLRDHEASRENSRGWLEGKQRLLDALDCHKDPEETISTAQTILSCKPEGDAQLTELRRQSQSLCEREDLDQPTRRHSQEALEELEQRWRALLEGADSTLREAEVQYSLSRELEAFNSQAVSTTSWLDELRRQFESKGSGAQGNQAVIEERLNTAQVILSSKSSSETQLTELRRRAQSLCDREELQGDRKMELQSRVKDVDSQWRALLQAASDSQRELSGVVELLVSCRSQRGQVEARLAELRKQTADLPRLFPWPGLGERRQAVEQARTLLDQSTALAPVISSLRKQSAELLDATQDNDWSDASLKEMEESIPAQLKVLTEAVSDLEQGILAERQCTQLVEQHEAAQDWLREQVKSLAAPPAAREGLHGAVNTLKALLQTVDREQREMQELDAARDGLLGLCTPGGRDALTLEISHLHDLCATSKCDVQERLVGCEAQLEELAKQASKRAAALKERGAALQWELRSLDQALSYSEPQDNIAQLQQHWQSLQNCEKSLQGLGEKVHELHEEVKSVPANELPGEIISMVDSLCQQHDSLKSRLDEHRCNCSTNAARNLTDTLQALQRWSHSSPAESAASLQATSDEGEKLQTDLREALSHRQFLTDSLTSDLFDKLMGEGSEALGEAEKQMASVSMKLKELQEKSQEKVAQAPIVAPPRRNKQSPKKKLSIAEPDKSALVEKESSISVEAKSLKLDSTSEPGSTEYLFVQRVIEESVSIVKEELAQSELEQESQPQTESTTKQAGAVSKDETKPADTSELPCVVEEIKDESLNSATESIPNQVLTKETRTAADQISAIEGFTEVELKETTPEPEETSVTAEPGQGQAEIVALDKSKLVPPKRKSKSVDTETQQAEEHQRKKSVTSTEPNKSVTEDKTPVPTRRKSRTSDISTTSEPAGSQDGSSEKAKLSPTKRKSKGGKPSPVLESKKGAESMKEPVVQKISDSQQTNLVPARRKSKTLDMSTASEPKSKEATVESRKASLTSQISTGTPESAALEPGKISPPKRKPKSSKATPELPKKEPPVTKTEPRSEELSSIQDVGKEHMKTVKNGKLPPTRRKSQTLPPEADPKKGTETKKEPEGQKPSHSKEETKEAELEVAKLTPPRRKSKGLDGSTATEPVSVTVESMDAQSKEAKEEPETFTGATKELPEKKVATVVLDTPPGADVGGQTLTEQFVMEISESVVVEEGMVAQARRKSKSSRVSPERPTSQPADTKEQFESDKPPSLPDAVTRSSEITAEEKVQLSPTRRKSVEVSIDELIETTKEPQNLQSLDSRPQTEEYSETTKIIPTRRKSSGPAPEECQEKKVAKIILDTPDQSVSGQTLSTQIGKHISESVPVEEKIPSTKDSSENDMGEQKHNKEPHESEMLSTSHPVPETTEVTTVVNSQPAPPKRRSKDLSLPAESLTPEVTADEPKKQESSGIEQQNEEILEATKVIPSRRKSKGVDDAKISEPVFASVTDIGAPSDETQHDSEISTDVAENQLEKMVVTVELNTPDDVVHSVDTLIPVITDIVHVQTSELGEDSVDKVDTSTPHPEPVETEELKDKPKEALEQTQPTEQTTRLEGPDYMDMLWTNTAEVQKRYLVLDLPGSGVLLDGVKPLQTGSIEPAFAVMESVQQQEVKAKTSSSQQELKPSPAVTPLETMKSTEEGPKEDKEHGHREDHTPEKTFIEMIVGEVQDSSAQSQENVTKSDSSQPASTAVQPRQAETFTEISLCEPAFGETTHPVIQLELVKTTKEEHKEVKDHGPVSLETATVGKDRIPKEDDLHKSKTQVKDGQFSVLLAKESRVDIQTNVQCESNTEDQESIPQSGSAQLNSATQQLDGTEFIEINLYEKAKPQRVETKAGVSETEEETKAMGNRVEMSTQDTPANTGETPLMKKIEVGPEVQVLQLDIASSLEGHEDKQAKEPMINIDVKISREQEMEKREVAFEIKTVEVQENSREKQQNITQSDTAGAQPVQTPSEETPSQAETQPEPLEPTGGILTKVKDHGVQEEQMVTQEVEILENKAELSSSQKRTPSIDETVGIISLEATGPNQDADKGQSQIAVDVHPQAATEKQEMSTTTQENGAQSVRYLAETLSEQEQVKPSQHQTELQPRPKRPVEWDGNGVPVKEATEVPVNTTDKSLHGVDLPQDRSPLSDVDDDATLAGGSPFKKHQDEAEKSTGALIIQADRSPMRGIFSEIQTLAQTGPTTHPNEVKPLEDSPGSLTTCTSDLDDRLSRLLSKLLSCKNRSPELSPAAVSAQLKEAEECHEAAQAQVLLLSQLRTAESESKDALEFLEDQWNAAAQDAAAVIQSKEAQMQLVTDFCRQVEVVKTTLERLTDKLRQCPSESSSNEAECLCSLQRSIEENRTELGQLLLAHNKLCLRFNQHQLTTANTELKKLQERWGGLERAVEKKVHHSKVQTQETSNLLADISALLGQLESVNKDFEAPTASQWNYKEAQQLMVANAKVKAAQKKYLLLLEISEALLHSSGSKDTKEIQQGLQKVKDQLTHTEKLLSSKVQGNMNPIMEKIITVTRDGLAWAKQTEADIEGKRKRVALLPEEVHQQLRDLRKLQFEVTLKQSQLESLVEEVTELLPQLDQEEEVPMVRSSLETLEELSKSTSEKLASCVRETESGLQTREKLSGQIADLDSWVEAQLLREAARNAEAELRSSTEFERRDRQIQETLAEAEKQSAACEALLMKSRDIASELSITENGQLFSKLTKLQDDIKAIISNERLNKKELEELIQTGESSKRELVTIEKSLRQMLVDLNKHRFPITRESLQALEPFKHMVLEHKSQVDLLQQWIPQEKTKEMYSSISEIYSKLVNLQMKSKDHECYLNMRQSVEDLRESVQEQVRLPKDDCRDVEDKYKICQSLLVQFPLIKSLCQEAASKLQTISTDLYPSQLTVERQRLEQNKDSLNTLEMTAINNLSIIEWGLLKELDLDSEKKATHAFLKETHQELQRRSLLEPNEATISEEHHRLISLRRTVESRVRAWEILEQRKGKKGSGSRDLMDLKNIVLKECDTQMGNIALARKSLRSYNCAVTYAVWFLRDTEASMLPPQGSVGVCSQRLPETQQLLASLEQTFQTHMDQIRDTVPLHPLLCPQQVGQLQEKILSQLLVRMSIVKARGQVQLESLNRCAEQHRKYTERREEITQRLRNAESRLSQLISQKITCLSDCTDQQVALTALSEEVESLQRCLEELSEWCPEQSCRMSRKSATVTAWRRISRLRRCTRELTSRSNLRIAEWTNITSSVDRASAVLQQVEAESPGTLSAAASTDELHDLQQSWEQYQDRLDFEHRALSALELRIARLLGVPAHLEQAPPMPLCQQLQAMQARYSSVKAQSREGLQTTRQELADRDKVREELQVVQVWTLTADSLLSEMEQSCSTVELQEIHRQLCTQKALLQRVMENLKVKYLDLYSLVPVEIEAQLQETKAVLQQVEVKVGKAVERSGPVHRLGAKLSEIQSGLESVQKRLEQRSPSVGEAKATQKRVWDELDVWHSCLAALEVDMQDLEHPAEALSLTERLVEVQQLHSHLAKQAEQRTTLISKIHSWLQEHREMISSSHSWMSEAQSWLAAPCTYKTAKCLSSHVNALQMVLNDSAQIRITLQGFSSVLEEMSQVCEVTQLKQQLLDTDQEVAAVQQSFTAPLAQLEHAAAEVEAIEEEVKKMEGDVTEIKTFLSSPETFPSPREQILKKVESRIQSMRRTIAEIQKCKPGLCLPEKAEETLGVFVVVDHLQMLLLELEKKVPALFIQQPPTPIQVKAQPSLEGAQDEKEGAEPAGGLIRVAHVEEDVLRRSGAALLTVERASPEQRKSWTPDGGAQPEQTGLREEPREQGGGGGGVLWWLWDAFLGSPPEEQLSEVGLGTDVPESQATGSTQDVEGPSSSAALSKPLATVRTQALPSSMVNTASLNLSKADSGAQQKCVVS